MVVCRHNDPFGAGVIAAYPDGRTATYLDEIERTGTA
jgi:hypothetical protein